MIKQGHHKLIFRSKQDNKEYKNETYRLLCDIWNDKDNVMIKRNRSQKKKRKKINKIDIGIKYYLEFF